QGIGHFPRDDQRLLHRELRLPDQPVAERLALDVGHDIVEKAGRLSRIEKRQDVGVVQPGGELDLPQEPLGAEGHRELRSQHLDRDEPLVLGASSQEDERRPPPSTIWVTWRPSSWRTSAAPLSDPNARLESVSTIMSAGGASNTSCIVWCIRWRCSSLIPPPPRSPPLRPRWVGSSQLGPRRD